MTPKKIIGQIHLWLGLASGLVVFILGITGCIWAFEEELKAWVYADKLKVKIPADSNALPLSQHLETAQNVFGKDIRVDRMHLPNRKEGTLIFRNYTPNKNPTGIWYWNDTQHNLWAYINPYTSEVIDIENYTFEFFRVVLALHWSLLLKNEIGQPIVGTATLIFIVMLLTGLILWWPRNKKALRMNTWFRWKSTTKWKRKNYDLHNIVGFYSMFLVLFIALTGLMWAFSWFNIGVEWIANGGERTKKNRIEVVSTPGPVASSHPLDIAYHHLKKHYVEAEIYYINLPQEATGTIGAYVAYKNRTKNVYLQFDQYSGKLLHTGGKWEDKTNGEKVKALQYDIHIGAIGGLVGKTIAFFLSFFAASLPITGFLIWYGRTFKKRKSKAVQKQAVGLNPTKTS
ncbi:MAG: PepSY-associated TM helix domain-containing protein [Bacteroidota bacterium]